MPHPFVPTGITLAVAMGLYAFYCHWEAGRVELATAFRHREQLRSRNPAASPSYRSRARWALLGSAVLTASTVLLSR